MSHLGEIYSDEQVAAFQACHQLKLPTDGFKAGKALWIDAFFR